MLWHLSIIGHTYTNGPGIAQVMTLEQKMRTVFRAWEGAAGSFGNAWEIGIPGSRTLVTGVAGGLSQALLVSVYSETAASRHL